MPNNLVPYFSQNIQLNIRALHYSIILYTIQYIHIQYLNVN